MLTHKGTQVIETDRLILREFSHEADFAPEGKHLIQTLTYVYEEEAEAFIVPAGEKFRVDLKGVNAALLRRAGVRDIDISCDCTACRPDRYWSHRNSPS